MDWLLATSFSLYGVSIGLGLASLFLSLSAKRDAKRAKLILPDFRHANEANVDHGASQ